MNELTLVHYTWEESPQAAARRLQDQIARDDRIVHQSTITPDPSARGGYFVLVVFNATSPSGRGPRPVSETGG